MGKIPVLEWRAVDAANKLISAASAMCQALPDGDQLDMEQTQTWIRSTAAGAIIGADPHPQNQAEIYKRSLAVMLGAISAMEQASETEKAQFRGDVLKYLTLL